ncbi:FAD binding domain-containing protein isoform 1 [Cladophialophora immunda]|nr:FAD binding domain-containing protein isoform 1 [Cladophialophora immunda]
MCSNGNPKKSHQGLLQSLLYTVLDKHPSAIPLVFADIWDSLWDKETDEDMPHLTLVEVKRAFSTLVSLDLPFRMCFFVDGIDEYDGDHVDICSFLMSTCSARVKLVLSSRPINACIEAFRHCPSLRLEDLTYPDIKQFVDDRLARHEKMQLLLKTQPLKAPILVEELIAKASGVFLWVRLVVKSLLDGLRNDDQVSDLLVRLRLIPPDLENLYRHMLGKMSPLYREQAAQLFQIIQYARELWVNRPLKTLLLSYAEFDSEPCLQVPLGPLDATEALQRCRTMENRLRSRCCGLLETRYVVKGCGENSNQTSLNDESSTSGIDDTRFVLANASSIAEDDRDAVNSNVQYLHRTVAEFLHRKEVWASLVASEDALPSMSITAAIGRATLVKLKISLISEQDCMIWASNLLNCCKTTEAETNEAQVQILDELDRVMCYHWHRGGGWGRNHWAALVDCDIRYHHMFALAVRFGLGRYVEEKLNDLGPDLIHCGGMPLLRQLIKVRQPQLCMEFDEVPCMASLLLRYGVDPNEMYDGFSTWQCAMFTYRNEAQSWNMNAWISLLSLLVMNGADVNAPFYFKVPGNSSAVQKSSSMSPLRAVREVHRRLLDQDETSTATSELEDLLLEYGAQLNLDRDRAGTDEIPFLCPPDAESDEDEEQEENNPMPARDHSSMTAPVWKLAAAIFADETTDQSEYEIAQAKVKEILSKRKHRPTSREGQGGNRFLQDALSHVQTVVDERVKDLRYHMGQGDQIPKWHYMAQGYLPKSRMGSSQGWIVLRPTWYDCMMRAILSICLAPFRKDDLPPDLEVPSPVTIDSVEATKWSETTDVLVVGFGAAGAAAALQARELDAQVIAVDRFGNGGATFFSGGVIYAGGTEAQRQNGVDDSPEEMFKYLNTEGCPVEPETLRKFCQDSASNVEWVVQHGLPYGGPVFFEKTAFPPAPHKIYYSGNEAMPSYAEKAKPAPRGHMAAGRGFGGSKLYKTLRDAAEKAKVRFLPHTKVTRLVVDRDHHVVGAEVMSLPQALWKQHDKLFKTVHPWVPFNAGRCKKAIKKATDLEARVTERKLIRARHGVVLCSGGYNRNLPLVEKYQPVLAKHYEKTLPLGSISDNGASIALGASVGGVSSLLSHISVARTMVPPNVYANGVLVNAHGKRFINEGAYAMFIGTEMLNQPDGKGYLILESRDFWYGVYKSFFTGGNFLLWGAPALINIFFGGTRRARSMEKLAKKIKVPSQALREQIEEYNNACLSGQADKLGKMKDIFRPVAKGPFYAVNVSLGNRFNPAQSITMGGLVVDEPTGNVKREDGTTVPGLYAAGRAAIGVCSGGFVSGMALADALFSGRRAGRTAATHPITASV